MMQVPAKTATSGPQQASFLPGESGCTFKAARSRPLLFTNTINVKDNGFWGVMASPLSRQSDPLRLQLSD